MIRLKNVSKYYYSKGMIASGISKVNLQLDMGEFVVITGESGSGKSTLLNVISGLDSYEDGEMYIEGKETSHYLASDFEEYRKKYIGNIFQKFNLVNSYTVYQNIELPLLINGYKKKDIKERVREIIKKVGLEQFANKKVSKLSGGQMQRVAIARALAKDTDIIVADEPTGNLDSESAEGIVKLLHEISHNKLVIVVTHNYDQFERYATRKIKMHDGKIAEDERLTPQAVASVIREDEPAKAQDTAPEKNALSQNAKGRLTAGSKLRLGVRNAFNLFYKFILLLMVFVFITFAVTAEYSSYLNQKTETEKLGYNDYFYNYSEDRAILKKADGTSFTQEDIDAVKSVDNIKSVTVNDMLLDNPLYIEDKDFSYEAFPKLISEFDGKLVDGRMPEKDNEIIFAGYEDDYYFDEGSDIELLDKSFEISTSADKTVKVKIVGIAYKEKEGNNYYYGGDIFVSDDTMADLREASYSASSKITIDINGKKQQGNIWGGMNSIASSSKVSKGSLIVPEELNSYYDTEYSEGNAKGKKIDISVENIFYKKSISLEVSDVYTEKTFRDKTGEKDVEMYNGTFYMNPADFARLFEGGNYQISAYVDNTKLTDETMNELEQMGYVTLALKDALIFYDNGITNIVQTPIMIVIIVALFFIAYFVIRLILKSRTSYFSILRMLGAAKKNIRRVMDVELVLIANIAFALFLGFILAVKEGYVNVEYISTLIEYVKPVNLAVMYVVIMLMTYLISGKFSKSLFKKTALGTFREEE